METSATIKDPKALTPAERWSTEIAYAEKELKKFHERAKMVTKRFIDERDAIDSISKWFNLFYSNVEILSSALYAQLPKPDVRRKYLDYNDDVARVAATIIQRCISPDKDDPRDNFDAAVKQCVQDRLVPGLSQVWLRLETDVAEQEYSAETSPEPGEKLPEGEQTPLNGGFATQEAQPQPQPQKFKVITDQRVALDYVYWEDFLWSPCRIWEERRWVARRVFMDYESLVRRFGEDKAKTIPLNYNPNTTSHTTAQSTTPINQAIQRAVIYEIWDNENRKVIWFCKDMPSVLDEKNDPLGLIGFAPCPRPMLANISTSNTTPRPDYYMIQDQYSELDTVNNRISMLVRACKVVGVYDRSSEGVQRMMQEGFDNTLIPVDNWAAFAEKGGVKGQIDWLPLDQVVAALDKLYMAREAIKQQIYELTGIADIVRGASKASETLGAQEIKAKFASVRIQKLQGEVACFCSEVLRIKAEIMVKHFDPEILLKKSNILNTDDFQFAVPAIQLLQSEEGFEWRIDVSADQIAQMDYSMQKEDRIELMSAVTPYLERALPLATNMPQLAPLVVNMLKWVVSGFRGARDIEGMLDRTLDQWMKNPPQPPKDPKAEAANAKAQADIQKGQQQAQQEQQRFQMDMAMKQMDMRFEAQKQQMDMIMKRMDMIFERQKMELELQYKKEEQAQERMGTAIEMQHKRAQHQMDLEFAEESHEAALRQAEEKGDSDGEE